ncbi:MAG: GIY-YIG nuclease family protein [Janthinobacterium lividum]
MAYVYIASNPGFKPGLLKIGLSDVRPEARLRALSRSTAAPASFKLEFFKETRCAAKVETRVHSLLEGCRFGARREFFDIELERASRLVERVVELTEFQGPIATQIGKSEDLLGSHYRPRFTVTDHHLMGLVMASTHDMMFRHVVRFQRDIVDGFLDAGTIARHLPMQRQAAARALHRFARKAQGATVHFIKNNNELRVFKELKYHRGELRWLFEEDFLDHFTNNKL